MAFGLLEAEHAVFARGAPALGSAGSRSTPFLNKHDGSPPWSAAALTLCETLSPYDTSWAGAAFKCACHDGAWVPQICAESWMRRLVCAVVLPLVVDGLVALALAHGQTSAPLAFNPSLAISELARTAYSQAGICKRRLVADAVRSPGFRPGEDEQVQRALR